VQVDPIKPTLKALRIDILKLKYDGQLSNFAFKLNMRRSNKAIVLNSAAQFDGLPGA